MANNLNTATPNGFEGLTRKEAHQRMLAELDRVGYRRPGGEPKREFPRTEWGLAFYFAAWMPYMIGGATASYLIFMEAIK